MNNPSGPPDSRGTGGSLPPGSAPEPFIADFSEGLETGLYLALLELIDEGLIITGDETILDVNSAACRLLERDYREIAGKPLNILFPSEKAFLQARERLFIQGEMRGSLQVLLPGGRLRSMRFVAAARLRPGIHALILSPDLIAETYAPAAYTPHTDMLWPRLAAALEQPVIVLDEAGKTAAANAAALKLLNFDRSRLIGQPLTALIDIEWPRKGEAPLARLSGPQLAATQARVLPGPKPHWRVLVLPPSNAGSVRSEADKTAPPSPREDYFERVFRNSPLPTFLCEGPQMRIFAVNEAAIQLYGYSRTELCAMSIRDLRTPALADERPRERNLWRHRTRDGRRFDVEMLAYPVHPPGHPDATVLMHDMPDRPLLASRLYLPADIASAAAEAIDRRQLTLYFQPLVDIRDGSIRSGEALLRWRHPEIGLLPFRRFMGVARDDGLLARMGDWVLQSACRHAATWPTVNTAPPGLTVNIANEQILQDRFEERVKQALHDNGLPATRLELDFDETILNEDNALIGETFAVLHDHGIALAIDDFGRGAASLAHLRQYPVQTVKLAPSLIERIGGDGQDAGMIDAITGIARSFGLKMLARGIATRAQQNFMSAQGCHLQQGPLFGPPLSAEDFLILIQGNQTASP